MSWLMKAMWLHEKLKTAKALQYEKIFFKNKKNTHHYVNKKMESTDLVIPSKLSSVMIDIFPWEALNHRILGDISHPAVYNPFRHDITAVCHFSLLAPSFCKNAHTALIIHALQCRSTASDTSKWFRGCLESSSFLHAMYEADFFPYHPTPLIKIWKPAEQLVGA